MSNSRTTLEDRIPVRTSADVPVVISQTRAFAKKVGFDDWTGAHVVTAASELASNISKYASHGEIRLAWVRELERACLEIEAVDRGPGIADVELALTESYSSSGTLGLGLPSVRRIMDTFKVDEDYPGGCRIVTRKYLKNDAPR